VSDLLPAALIGGAIGAFFGGFSKFLWERWLPDVLTWRRAQRVEREHELSSLRAPVFSALTDLQARLRVIAETQAANARYTKAIGEADYYRASTAYLVARAFAAQHLLRVRLANFDYAELYQKRELTTTAQANGGPGFQFFRLEQREIAERMLMGSDAATFSPLMFSAFMDEMEAPHRARWIETMYQRVESLLANPYQELDRLQCIDEALTQLVAVVDANGQWQVPGGPAPIDAVSIRQRLAKESDQQPQEFRSRGTQIDSP
jgi:hypothetical protein